MALPSTSSNLTPKHVRAARALLAWSQQDLAKAAAVATSTVADFERGQRTPVANNAQAIRNALENAGIRFLPTGAIIGPASPIIATSYRSGAPVRWVSAEDLSNWANRNDGAASLPTLVAHLIQATPGSQVKLRFPSDEGVQHPGWDGLTSTQIDSTYVPKGDAGWEIGTQRSKIAQKASEDYAKRTKAPAPLDPANAAYVFVTPRHWPAKDQWAKERQEEGPWREVRVYDSDELVHWIEQTPAVGLWLAARMGKRPPGTRELEEIWKEWSLATQWPLTEALILCDRDQDAAEVLRWLRGEPSVISLQGTTTEEVIAFVHAALSELPEDIAAIYRTRCLVVNATAAKALANAPAPLILLLTDPEPGLARSLVERGHYVLLAYDERPIARGEIRTLARPSRDGIASTLTEAGIAEPRAKALARDSARNLAVLRRLIPAAPGRLPKWAEQEPPRALLAALLAGGWDENTEADQAQLSQISSMPYETLIADLAPYVGFFDSPLQKIGSTWRISSPSDAWFLLAHHLTSTDIARFEASAHAVLSSADPRFNLDPDERWLANVRGIHRNFSGMLRHGIGQVLILLALWGERVRTVPEAGRRANTVVSGVLSNADEQRWWSLSDEFRLLAEASPGAFLTAIEESLDQSAPPILSLFGHDKGGVLGTEHLSDLMWALESLAWSPDWMPRVTQVLARLDAIDIKPRHYSNGPANSLREIHLLWRPQTFATLDQRLRILDLVRKQEPNTAWKLMLGILPQGRDSSIPTPLPRWRDFTVDTIEIVTMGLVERGATEISKRLLEDVSVSSSRWIELLDRFGDLATDLGDAFIALEAAESQITDESDRLIIWEKLRHVLHHHRQFPDAEWSLPVAVLDRLESAYKQFAPIDPAKQVAWLFQQFVKLPRTTEAGWESEDREVDAARKQAVQTLLSEGGIPAVLSLARLTEAPGLVGKAIYESGLPYSDIDTLLEAAVRSADAHERYVAHGLIVSAFRDRKEAWAATLVARARDESWGDITLLTILRALPMERWTWEQVSKIGGETEVAYWRQAPAHWMIGDSEDTAYAIEMLISVGRARHALPLAERNHKANLPSDVLVKVLREAARQPFEIDSDRNEATMFQHYVSEILQLLDDREDVDRNTLVELEWNYLAVLEHSPRPAKVLHKALSEQPSLFIEVLSAVFKASEESGDVDPEPVDPDRARTIAMQAFKLLELWSHIPGTRDDGTIDGEILEHWIKEARALAKEVGREDVADSQIGNVLSASPMGSDGNWPAEPIREVIDLFRSKPLLDGFQIGKRNRRGVTTRMPRDGGELERNEAAAFRAWAKAVAYDHPHTAKALDSLADSYEDEAGWHDESAERLDWEV